MSILTLSFRGDLELCRLLCESVDTFVPETFEHIIAVPRADLDLFAPLANPRRRIVSEAGLTPRRLYKVPLPSPRIRRLLRLPRRNIYATPSLRLVRGWIAQQLMKLSAVAQSASDVVIHIDSDVAFIRPLAPEHVVRDGRARLLRFPGLGDDPMHHSWHLAASKLLGLEPNAYHGADYIGNLVVWRKDCANALLQRVSEVAGGSAMAALAGTEHFSEYILYGVFCEKVLGLEGSGHFASPTPICETVWASAGAGGVDALLANLSVSPDQIAVGVQSTVPVSIAQRSKLLQRLRNTA